MDYRNDLTAVYVRSILSYDVNTGELRWRKRKDRSKEWNTRYAEKIAGNRRPDGYIGVMIDGVLYLGHRVIWLIVKGRWPEKDIDHRDLNRTDDKFDNLREATSTQNHGNRGCQKNSWTGLKGVNASAAEPNRYQARIQKNGKRRNLGSFRCPAAAHFAYVVAAYETFEDFARSGAEKRAGPHKNV